MTGQTISALIFDLDGTLVDSLPDLAEAMNELMAENGLAAHAQAAVGAMVGNGVTLLVQRAFSAHGIAMDGEALERQVARYLDLYEPRSARLTRFFPHVEGIVQALRGQYALGVCTNKPTGPARQILEDLGFSGVFGAVVGGDSGVPRKPEGDMIMLTAERLGVPLSEAVMIGDSPADVKSAQAAGIRSIAVRYGYTVIPADELGADAVVDDFREIPRLLEIWQSRS
ncbi:phosphoglycolate phosphatase [Oryzibacter oryziterrae]|uniref:phosphoglycolate phosphatase n=1 Tax=Oryzibacter oryziterrae TaxID=2766474 RepID=UPI001EED2912|nr:phosphoglycolate phosphatase [Oryzibacter oryziterrae]